MDNVGQKSVNGLVVGQASTNQYYVWCREAYPGKDGFLTVDTYKPINIGDWVSLKFTPSEYLRYFPTPKNKYAEQFRTSNYDINQGFYDTKVEGKSIKFQLELPLLENQTVFEHPVFGKIYNNMECKFPTGVHLVTIKRVVPRPNMESVWVMESLAQNLVPQNPEEVELIGIVAGADQDFWYVWTKERPVGWDITIKKGGATVTLGSWVRVTVPRKEMSTAYFLEATKFQWIKKELHKTEVFGKKVSLTLQCNILGHSTVIHHPFFGKIINDNFEIMNDGTYEITIVRRKPKTVGSNEKSVWFLDNEPKIIQGCQPVTNEPYNRSRMDQPRNMNRNRSKSRTRRAPLELTGIIVAQDWKYLYVWCSKRLPGFDMTIRKTSDLKLTDYVKFTVTENQFSQCFPQEMPGNGVYPPFEVTDYQKIDKKFKTFTSGREGTTINMELEVNIERPTSGDISHDFVGLIINDRSIRFETSGHYKITINRFKKRDELPRSVWYLKSQELIPSDSMNHLSQSMQNLNLAPPQPIRGILKYSSLERQTNRMGSYSDFSLDQPGPAPPARRSRQDSQSTTRGRSQSRRRSKSRNRNKTPIPAPRTSLGTSPTQNSKCYSEAIILNIVEKEDGKEDIHVWIFGKLQQGFLNLPIRAEKQDLKIGSQFGAEFIERNGKWKAFDPKPPVGPIYETSVPPEADEIEILVHGKGLNQPDFLHRYPWIKEGNFGEILDINNRIGSHTDLFDHFWIKRYYVNNRWEWIVVKVDTDRNNGHYQ